MNHGKAFSLLSPSLFVLLLGTAALARPDITTIKVPDTGLRPQVVRDVLGTVHMVYASPERDLLYVRQAAGQEDFSKPTRVNSTAGCLAAFNMAVGKGGRVHVFIRPNALYSKNRLKRQPKFIDLKYMLYCRLNDEGTAFEEERDLSGETYAFEGVGALIADGKGRVLAFWHGLSKPGPEYTRNIFMAVSDDEGKEFTSPRAIQNDVAGACACCAMQGTMDGEGNLYLGYRNSEKSMTKDSYLLTSRDGGKTFTESFLDPWENAGCPGSIYSLTGGSSGAHVAWSTQGQVYFASAGNTARRVAAPTAGKIGRSPIVVSNSRGEVLFVWSEAASVAEFKEGGDLAWRVYDGDGKPVSEKKVLKNSVARWSFPAAYARPDGGFVIFYDGPGAGQ